MDAETAFTGENGTLKPINGGTDSDIQYEDRSNAELLYNVTDRPPIYLTVFFALQQSLLSLSGSLATSLLVADVACVGENAGMKTRMMSSTLFMNGFTTICMVLFGVRLPLFQGPAADYIVPLMAMQAIQKDECVLEEVSANSTVGANMTLLERREELFMSKIQQMEGCLILAGFMHALIGASGCVGFFLRGIGPVTIVPTILLSCIFITRATAKFAMVHWGISSMTAFISLLLSLYLGKHPMPIPTWNRKKGFRIIHYPLHQVFSILIAMVIGWIVCGIMTSTGSFSDQKNATDFYARTDARAGLITDTTWFTIPYPGQFGPPSFGIAIFVSFSIATMTSILDSIGDYYACASMCKVPPPPKHAINRGIAIEGLCSAVSGALGCGHATSTYGGNIGAIGVTRVASRDVFLMVGVIYFVFGIVGKISALFVTIPYPVLGGAMIIMFGMFFGVVLSNLQNVSLTSTRNLAVMGTSILIGLMIPYWTENFSHQINTGNEARDTAIKMLLANPNLTGGITACILDNTVPGPNTLNGYMVMGGGLNVSAQGNTMNKGRERYKCLAEVKRGHRGDEDDIQNIHTSPTNKIS